MPYNTLEIVDAETKLASVLSQYESHKTCVSYSGGADSDTILHMVHNINCEVPAVFFDTGLEYEATHKHVSSKNNVFITKAKLPIPLTIKKFGVPFISKFVSEMLSRLQRHNFDFKQDGNKSYDELVQQFPNAKSALAWWTNKNKNLFRIDENKFLKQFIIEYGLPFAISGKCCDYAKKYPAKTFAKEHNIQLMFLGMRKAEGGIRSRRYKNCYVKGLNNSYGMFFPMFWWNTHTKTKYDQFYNITYSDCYTVYNLKRTGCAGCPFGKRFENELRILNRYEPKLYRAVNNIFSDSYNWTRKYIEYVARKSVGDNDYYVQSSLWTEGVT